MDEMQNEILEFFRHIYEQANWIDILIGFSLSLTLPIIATIYTFIIYVFKNNKYKGYYGDYYLYAYFLIQSMRNGKDVNAVKIQIKKNYFGKPKILWYDGKYKYKGKLKIYDKNIYMYVTGISHHEDQLLIFKLPLLPEQFDLVCGIKVAITAHGDPAASINILSRKMLSKEESMKILGSNKTLKLNNNNKNLAMLKDQKTLLPKN